MSIREQIKNDIIAKAARASDEILLIKNTPDITREEVTASIHRYVCSKFFIEPEDTVGMTLNEMAEFSLDKALELKLPLARESERATTCGMAGSAPMKIALLLNALRKDLEIQVDLHRLGMVMNTDELGDLIFNALKAK